MHRTLVARVLWRRSLSMPTISSASEEATRMSSQRVAPILECDLPAPWKMKARFGHSSPWIYDWTVYHRFLSTPVEHKLQLVVCRRVALCFAVHLAGRRTCCTSDRGGHRAYETTRALWNSPCHASPALTSSSPSRQAIELVGFPVPTDPCASRQHAGQCRNVAP